MAIFLREEICCRSCLWLLGAYWAADYLRSVAKATSAARRLREVARGIEGVAVGWLAAMFATVKANAPHGGGLMGGFPPGWVGGLARPNRFKIYNFLIVILDKYAKHHISY